MTTYKIIRGFLESERRDVIATGLTIRQARAHCKDPETSSRTATGPHEALLTEIHGPWFDGYEEE